MACGSAAIIGGDEHLLRDLRVRYSHIRFFHHAAPHGLLNNPQAQFDVVHFVESCSAGVAFFAVGSPQSEYICALIAKRGNATGVGLCIGASLEFLTGAKSRAPGWMQKVGPGMAVPPGERTGATMEALSGGRADHFLDLVALARQFFSLTRRVRFHSLCRAEKNLR